MYKLCFYVPETHVDLVKESLFQAGAGRLGAYEHCAWQVKGEGQFRPLSESKPFLGQHGQLEVVIEYKVEMICDTEHIEKAIAALKTSHPYEEPAYQVIPISDF